MKRKVIKQGLNAYTITLPTTWVKQNNITRKSEVDVNEENNILTIYPNYNKEHKSIELNLEGFSNTLIWRKILSAYRTGYDEIKIQFKNTKNKMVYSAFTYDTIFNGMNKKEKLDAIEIIQLVVNRSIGLEIIEQGPNYCTIKEMSEISIKELDNVIRRMFLILINISEQIEKSVQEKTLEDLKNMHLIDTNLDRLEDFCIRILNKIGYREPQKTTTIYNIIFFLELIGDEYKELSMNILNTTKIKDDIQQILVTTNELLRLFYKTYYEYDDKKMEDLLIKIDTIKTQTQKINRNLNGDEAKMIHHLKSIKKNIQSLIEIKLDMNFL